MCYVSFRALCVGSAGITAAGFPLHYRSSIIHRVIAGFMIQGGDFTGQAGKGGESIYGPTFDDEDTSRNIDEMGLLVMANKGKNTNGSQFFVWYGPSSLSFSSTAIENSRQSQTVSSSRWKTRRFR